MSNIPTASKPVSSLQANLVVGLLFAMFIVPNVYIIYLYKTGNMPDIGSTEKGIFFENKINLTQKQFISPNNDAWNTKSLNGKWAIVSFIDNHANKASLDRLFNTQQVLKTLTRYKGRSEHIVIITGEQPPSKDLKTVLSLRNDLFIAQNENQLSLQILAEKEFSSLKLSNLDDYIMILDPEGNLLMYYSAEHSPKAMLRDFKRLLKVSAAGYQSK